MKKCLSFILSVIMSISVIPQICNVSATSEDKNYTAENAVSDNATFTDSELNITGTNSLGNLLANELESDTEEVTNVLENDIYGIFDLSMEGNTASVSYYAKGGATLLVGIFDETGSQLFASGTYEIVTEDDGVENLISEIEIQGEIPEYYLAKAFILGSNQEPLCNEYICELYTEDITKVRESVISDYDSNLVVNLDESEETNFLVLSESTIQIEYNGKTNILESADDENCVYIFSNADEQILSLSKGDIFYYDYNNCENMIVVKINSITVDGEKVTITGDDAMGIEEAFEVIKIEKILDEASEEMNPDYEVGTDLGYGLVYTGLANWDETVASSEEIQNPSTFMRSNNKKRDTTLKLDAKTFHWEMSSGDDINLKVGKFEGSVEGSVNVDIALSVQIPIKIYTYNHHKAASFTIEPKVNIKGEFSIEASIKFYIEDFKWEPVFDILEFSESFTITFSGELKGSINGTLTFLKMSFNIADSSKEFFSFKLADFDGDIKVETEFFIGLEFSSKIRLGNYEASGGAKAGVQIERTLFSLQEALKSESDNVRHDCTRCVSGELFIVFSKDFKLIDKKSEHISTSSGSSVEIKIKIRDFYWSISNNELGWGECPHKSYRVNFNVVNTINNPINGAIISGFTADDGSTTAVTDESGNAEVFLSSGKYNVNVMGKLYDTEISDTSTFSVSKAPTTVKFTLDPSFIPVVVNVIDENGNPISGAVIDTSTRSNSETFTASGITNSDGVAEIKISTKGVYATDFSVSADGYDSATDFMSFSEASRNFTFRLTQDNGYFTNGSISITVVDENDNPISNALVEMGVQGSSIGDVAAGLLDSQNGTTDLNGIVKLWPKESSLTADLTVKVMVEGYPEAKYRLNLSTGETEFTFKITQDGGESKDDDDDGNVDSIIVCAIRDYNGAAINKYGNLYMWGDNRHGQLGNGTTVDSSIPTKIMDNVASVSLGRYHSAAITNDGCLYMWGYNEYGQLGNGTTVDSSTPIKIMDNVVSISLGVNHSAAITNDGCLYMWGYNGIGQLGDGTTVNSSTPIKIMDNVVSVTLGDFQSGAVTKDGLLYIWGEINRRDYPKTPLKIMENVTSVSLGYDYGAAIIKDGSLYMWGYNFYGQLGDRTTVNSLNPKKIMDNVVSISLGSTHSAAITEDGELYTWGDNRRGQIGNGTTVDSSTPIKIMNNVVSVSLGGYCSAAITEDGSMYTWGRNDCGQLGHGTNTYSSTPIKIDIVSETVLIAYDVSLDKISIQSAEYTEELIKTYTYSEAVPGTSYLLLAVNDTEAEDILSADNLFYIDQQTADESGSVTFNYIASDDCTYIFIGDFGKGEYCRVVSNAISTNTEQCTICKSSSDDDFPDNGDVTTTTSSITTATTTTSSTTTTMTTTTTTTVSGICGDVNCNGKVNIADAVALEKYISGSSYNITEEGIKNADVNLDGVINDKDVHYLKLSIMNFIKLPYIVEDPDNGILYGDVTCDGIVNVCDVIILNKYLSNSDYYLSTQSLLNADVDCDGEVTREDSTYILKSIVHLVMLPINKSN